MPIATLIAADRLAAGEISAARDALAAVGCAPGEPAWIEPEKACDISFEGSLEAARNIPNNIGKIFDYAVQSGRDRRKRLLVADMDSTMITVECLDELADYAGVKDEVSAITERAMQGEIDFAAALDERVALLKDLDAEVIGRCHDDRVAIRPGAARLVRTMRDHGARCILVSGGFTLFADRVGADIGFDRVVANRLDIESNRLAGTVARPIVDGAAKRETLIAERETLGLDAAATMAIGDGANDLAMIEEAGLGIAFHAKHRLRAAADICIDHGDLSALLYVQGYARHEWTQD